MKSLTAILGLVFACTLVQCDIIRIPIQRDQSARQEFFSKYLNAKVPFAKKSRATNVHLNDFVNSQYFGHITIGNPKQLFKVAFPISAGDFWVPSHECEGLGCAPRLKYNHDKSKTYEEDGTKYVVTYLPGTVSGYQSRDDVTIAGLHIKNVTFGELTKETGFELILAAFDGVFGLGFRSNTINSLKPPLFEMFDQGLIERAAFAFKIKSGLGIDGGTLTLGGSDPKLYKGDFTYFPLISKNNWEIKMDGGYLDDAQNPVKFCVGSCPAILEAGLGTITGPMEEARDLAKAIGAEEYRGRGIFEIDCKKVKTLPDLVFQFGSKSIRFSGKDYVERNPFDPKSCMCLFRGEYMSKHRWILGSNFMTNVYTEFDLEKKRIGFADLA